MRYPGYALASDLAVAVPVIQWVARQVRAETSAWTKYGERDETRREHLQELRAYLGLSPFGLSDFRFLVRGLTDLAMQTDKGLVLAAQALETLRQRQIILPALTVVERACAEAVTRANRRIYRTLTEPLAAAVALIQLACALAHHVVRRSAAARALEALGPACLLDRLGALLFRTEAAHELRQRHPLLELDSVHRHVLAPALCLPSTLRLIVGWGLAEDHC